MQDIFESPLHKLSIYFHLWLLCASRGDLCFFQLLPGNQHHCKNTHIFDTTSHIYHKSQLYNYKLKLNVSKDYDTQHNLRSSYLAEGMSWLSVNPSCLELGFVFFTVEEDVLLEENYDARNTESFINFIFLETQITNLYD